MSRALIVIAFDIPEDGNTLVSLQDKVKQIQPIFENDETVKVTGVLNKKAKIILNILKERGN